MCLSLRIYGQDELVPGGRESLLHELVADFLPGSLHLLPGRGREEII